jgi:amino acid transporter
VDEKSPLSFIRLSRRRPRRPGSDSKGIDSLRLGEKPAEAKGAEPSGHATRIVIPRQERGAPSPSEQDIELREVRYGRTLRGPYLRVVPRQRRFTRVAPGYLEATPLASLPPGTFSRYLANFKRVIIGSPFATSQALQERLTKVKALGVFSADGLSSAAYGPEEIMIALALAGSAVLYLALPVAGAIIALLWVIRLSYIQTIRAYPSGGGSYIVAHENLGRRPGQLAAAALLVDYTLTVSVSIAAGVAAVTSAVPVLLDFRVPMALAGVAVLTWGNLRGVRESGTMFAAPTYFFVLGLGTVITVGLIKVVMGHAPGSLLSAAAPREHVVAVQGLTLFLLLRAFSSGASALTGVEAISNGVPAFKPPESQNARTVMQWEAVILGFLVLGVAFLATRYGLVPRPDETIVSMLGREVLGKNLLYYGYQAATMLVLFMGANTSFADFPRLSAILAKDKFMPRQFAFKGDRLAFSHGILLLAAVASLLLVAFNADVTKLIPLYTLGVFVSITLSQLGMVRHWWRLRETGWRTSMLFNGIGAAATAVVSVIVATTKLTHGAWISVLMMLTLILMFTLVRHHYDWFDEEMRPEEGALPSGIPTTVPAERLSAREHVLVPVDTIDKVSLASMAFARELSSRVTPVHIADNREEAEQLRARWDKMVPDIPLLVIESPYRAFVAPMLAFVRSLQRSEPGVPIAVVLPSFVPNHWWERLLHNQDVLRLKRFLREEPGFRVVDFTYDLASGSPVT